MGGTATRGCLRQRLVSRFARSDDLRLRSLPLALALVAGAGLAACSSPAASPTTTTNASGGGTLTIASGIPPSDINPALSPDAVPEEWYDDLAYEPLIVHNPNGSFSPGLAVSWRYVGTGNTTFEINLRPGVRFSDGSRLTAAGVKQDIEYQLSGGQVGISLGKVNAIKVLGPLRLEISLAQSNAALPYLFTQNVDLGWIISPDGLAKPTELASSTHGAGPYMLDAAATIADSKYVYVPNPYYYDKTAVYWHKVIIEVITSPTAALAALATGQVQVMQGSTQLVAEAQSDGLHVLTAPGTNGPILMVPRITAASGPLLSPRVREALAYAVDRPAINGALFGKYSTVDEELEGPGDVGYVSSLADMYTYNLAKARQLLAAAGYPHGFSTSANCSPQLDLALVCSAVKADWAKIGVNLSVSAPIQDVWVSQLEGGKFGFTGIGAFETTAVVQTKNDFQPGLETGTYEIPGEAAAYQQANAAPIGSAAATAAWTKLQTLEMQSAAAIVVATPNLLMFTAKTITGVDFSPAQPVPYPLDWRKG
jgi:peptide/nickel transport system substrate-binding protein